MASDISKAEFRKSVLSALAAEDLEEADYDSFWRRVEALPAFALARTVLIYWGFGWEIPTSSVVGRWYATGRRVVLPRVVGDCLELREYYPSSMVAGYRGIMEPGCDAPLVSPQEVDFAVIPGVAFDRSGGRMGRGRGYYDRLLPLLRPDCLTVGVCRRCQFFDSVPVDDGDVPVREVMVFDTYNEKIEWLFSQFPSYQKVGAVAYKPGLDSMLSFACALGDPQSRLRCIHIAGTNGKGSVSHMLAAGLASCGLRVGLYTSPHLKDFRERIKIVSRGGFEMIPRSDVYSFLCRWEDYFTSRRPSFFEITTGMAFDWFARSGVDVAVVETGLGGRLDSTNIITPLLSVITNIGLEHCEHLGYTLEAVAGEKAGIIKPGVPAVVGEFLPATRPVFETCAAACGSSLVFASESERWLDIDASDLDLRGDYQQRNLRTLDAAARALSTVFPFDKTCFLEGVCRAAALTGLRGRWETLLCGGGRPTVVCDTGHNAHGLRWVAQQIDRISCDYKNVFLIIGLARDKDLSAIAPLLPRNVRYVCTQAASPRALPAADLANYLSDCGFTASAVPSVPLALEQTKRSAGPDDLIVITGSNYVIAEIL